MLQATFTRTALGAAFALVGGAAYADSISPTSFAATVGVGGTATVNKTVTVSAGTPTSAKVDVVFLTDTTGSMGGTIANVISGFASVASTVGALGDVNFAVQEYKDIGDAFEWRQNTAMTGNLTDVQNGINLYSAGGGGDTPEANLQALFNAANSTAWRPGSTRFVVWSGDAPGHDPSGSLGITEAQATAALQAAGVDVIALDVGGLDSTGQAGRITAATGGTLQSGVDPTNVSNLIASSIVSAFATYSTVCLDTSETPAGVSAAASACISGAFDRSVERTFDFTLSFTGDAPGTYSFNTYGTVDGGRVATEADRIVVGEVPEPASLAVLSVGLIALGAGRKLRRRG